MTSIGTMIKRLRKERGMTQEALAELLRVTPQTISKWENHTGMPDISQIVPLANIFGITTDELFGLENRDDEKMIQRILDDAHSVFSSPQTPDQFRLYYEKINEGLKQYPNNPILLIHALEGGIALAFPENDCYDVENAKEIYRECIRNAEILFAVSKNPTDILRAHMIMVLLHASHGNKEEASKHAKQFPWRSDMTSHAMDADIAHFEKNYPREQFFRQRNLAFHIEAVLDDLVQYARAFRYEQKYEQAITIYEKMLSLIAWCVADEEVVPSLHCREWGDVYLHLATLYINIGDHNKAIDSLTKMTDYDIHMRSRFTEMKATKHKSLLFQGTTFPGYYRKNGRKETLLLKLNTPALSPLANDKRYQTLLERANALE